MQFDIGKLAQTGGADLGDEVWVDVLEAVDKTYAELVDYQEQLEANSAELQTLRAFLSSIMSSISDYLVVTDKDGKIADASSSFCKAIGQKVADLIGRDIGDFFQGENQNRVLEAIAKTISLRRESKLEIELSTANGADPVDLRISPRLDRRRKTAGVILTGRPLGELRRAYTDLEASHEELKQTQGQLVRNEKLASLGRLLAGVAHELNNPISFVYANTHALEKYLDRFETYFEQVQSGASRDKLIALRQELRLDRDLKNLRTAIEGARDGSERVKTIVEDLRRLSADGTGEFTRFDLTETARISANWVQRGARKGVEVLLEGDPNCIAIGRPGHIQQVVMNLVQNAVDAVAEKQAPRVVLSLGYKDDQAILRVEDNGTGISEAVAARIFDPFFTTKDVGKGTGLGLSISYKIAQEHGGSLVLETSNGSGTTFRLSLPRGDQA